MGTWVIFFLSNFTVQKFQRTTEQLHGVTFNNFKPRGVKVGMKNDNDMTF